MQKNEIIERIQTLKKEKDVVILAHYYAEGDLQDIADYVGDSYLLSEKAQAASQQVILFCGVRFMGESAKILSPEKTVLMPELEADCPMAHMVTPEDIQKVRQNYDDLAVVCYINSTAEIKAYSDVCVTSSNAERVVAVLPQKNIFFIPDSNLGHHVAGKIPNKHFIFHPGYCPVHAAVTAEKVNTVKTAHPGVKVLMHPECVPEATALADYLGSTAGIIDYPEKDGASEYIIATEEGVLHALKKRYPDKMFYIATDDFICHDMKKNTLEKVLDVLENFDKTVELDTALRQKAEGALQAMHRLAKQGK